MQTATPVTETFDISELEDCISPTHSIFYAIITPIPQHDSGIHICRKPATPRAQLALHALSLYLWTFFTKIRHAFDLAFHLAQAQPALEQKMWKGDWLTQSFFNMDTFRRCSKLDFRFLHEPYSVDAFLDDIPPGTHWVAALAAREGLSLEMKFSEYGVREDGCPGPVKQTPEVELVVKRAFFHRCQFVRETSGSELVPVDGVFDWFRLELRNSPTPAFPMRAFVEAYGSSGGAEEEINTVLGTEREV